MSAMRCIEFLLISFIGEESIFLMSFILFITLFHPFHKVHSAALIAQPLDWCTEASRSTHPGFCQLKSCAGSSGIADL